MDNHLVELLERVSTVSIMITMTHGVMNCPMDGEPTETDGGVKSGNTATG